MRKAREHEDEEVFEPQLDQVGPPPSNIVSEEPKRMDEKVIREMFSKKNIDLKTDLSPDGVSAMTTLDSLAHRFNIPYLRFRNAKKKALLVSKERKGRAEAADILKADLILSRQERSQNDKLHQLLGLNR